MRRAGAGAALAATVVLAGCGAESPDLFEVDRTGDVPGAAVQLVVNDGGTVRCNHGAKRKLPGPLLLDARDLERAIGPDARHHRRYAPGSDGVFDYAVRSQDGTVRWADSSRPLPQRYFRFALLVRRIAQGPCGLPR